MPTPLQEWLHGTQDKVSSTRIDTQKKIGPKLAGQTAQDIMETKGIVDNVARGAATITTAALDKARRMDIPISGDYYDGIRWLLDGQSGTLPPYLNGYTDPPHNNENAGYYLAAGPNIKIEDDLPWRDERLLNLTPKTAGEDSETVSYNNFTHTRPPFASSILALIQSPYCDTIIDEGANHLKGTKQLRAFNRYLALSSIYGIAADDPQYFKNKNAISSDGWTPIGTRALFNRYRMNDFNRSKGPVFDTPKNRKKSQEIYKCDTDTLVQETRKGNMGRETFEYSDFMFCSHAGEVSNEHMITLRKFPIPCQDNILLNIDKDYNFKSRFNQPAIGCLVNWVGVSGNSYDGLLSFSYSQNSKAPSLDADNDENENGGILGKVSAMMDKKRADLTLKGGPDAFSGTPVDSVFKSLPGEVKGTRSKVSDFHAYKNANSIWRNNRVVRPQKMEEFGISYQHSMTVVFEYDLMNFGGINGRKAFLDLLANILITTSNECSFYGMAYKTVGVEPNEMINELYNGISGSKSFGENFSTLAGNIMGKIKSFFSGDPMSAVGTLLNNLGNSVIGQLMNKLGRNAFIGMNSNFTDAPLGNWHLTIGNPRHPIVTIGNLWLTDTKLEFSGPLNIDGFPSKIKVTCTLAECTDRDPIRIERIFQDGLGRTYHHVGKDNLIAMYTARGKEIKQVNVSNKKRNNETNQTEYTATIDTKQDSVQKTNSTAPYQYQMIETGICDLGCSGGDRPVMLDLT